MSLYDLMRTKSRNDLYGRVQDEYVSYYSSTKWYNKPYDINCSLCSLFEEIRDKAETNLLSIYFCSKSYCDVNLIDAATLSICCCLSRSPLKTLIEKVTPYDVAYHYFVFGCGTRKTSIALISARTQKALDVMRELHLVRDTEDEEGDRGTICLSDVKRLTNFHESSTINVNRNAPCCNLFKKDTLPLLVSNKERDRETAERFVLLRDDRIENSDLSAAGDYDNAGFRINRLLQRNDREEMLKWFDPWGAKRHDCIICRVKQLPAEREAYARFETKLESLINDRSVSVPTAADFLESDWPVKNRFKLIKHYDRANGDVVCGFNERKMFHIYDLVHDKNLLYKDTFLRKIHTDFLGDRSAVLCPSIYLACYVETAIEYNDKATAVHDFQWVYRLLSHHKVCVKL